MIVAVCTNCVILGGLTMGTAFRKKTTMLFESFGALRADIDRFQEKYEDDVVVWTVFLFEGEDSSSEEVTHSDLRKRNCFLR